MPKRILVIQTAFIGDAILTLPMLQVLKKNNPGAEIDVAAIPSTKIIFEHSPVVDSVHVLDKRGKHKSIGGLLGFAKQLKRKKYDVIYSPHRSFRTSLLVWFSGVKETYGFSNASGKWVYKNIVKYNPDIHEVGRNLSLIDSPVEDISNNLPIVEASHEAISKVEAFVEDLKPTRLAAIAPGSVWNTKRYPIEHYKDVAGYLADKGYQVLLLGGMGDIGLVSELHKAYPESTTVTAGKFDLIESIELLRRCEILICNDSAPTHMAMCADIPVVTLYCSTVPRFGFYPYSKKSGYLSYNDLDCKPCGIHGHNKCPIDNFLCGKELMPQNVINEIEKLLRPTISG